MVNSVSHGHAATTPEVGGNESPLTSSDPKVSNRLRDGLALKTRGVANRLTFEPRSDARELKILSAKIFVFIYLTTQSSSTP
jgi:hypothetical protein